MRNDNNRHRNHRRREDSESRNPIEQSAESTENKSLETENTANGSAEPQQGKVSEGKQDGKQNKPSGNDQGRKRRDNGRKKSKVNGERLLKDPTLEHSEDESDEDREYFDTLTAEELEEVTKMMRKKTAAVDKQDLESNVPAGEDWEPYLDMDIRTGVSREAGEIAANIFHTRGLAGLPNPEHAHCSQYKYQSCKLPSYNWMDDLDISLEHLNSPSLRFVSRTATRTST